MSLQVIRYPLDPTGTNPNNLVVNEPHTLINRVIRPIAPFHGPFYSDSVVLRDLTTQQPLTRNVDYYTTEFYEIPSKLYGKEICAVILITNPDVSNQVELTYQTVGGEYSYSIPAIVKMIEALNLDERPVNWPSILNRPESYTPAPHLHDAGDIYGFEYITQGLERIRSAILTGDKASHDEIFRYIDAAFAELDGVVDTLRTYTENHVNDKENPHDTTKAHVGLPLVENYPPATKVIADEGVSNAHYMTPEVTKSLLDTYIVPMLNAHEADMNNPHNVTRDQLDVYSTGEVDDILLGYVLKDATSEIDVRFRFFGNQLQVLLNSIWYTIWPPVWQ